MTTTGTNASTGTNTSTGTPSKLLYSATMSLDGFIAGAGGGMSWLTPYLAPETEPGAGSEAGTESGTEPAATSDPLLDELLANIGALLIGRRTFDGDDPHRDAPGEGEAFGGGWAGPQFVLTHRPPEHPVPGVQFVTDLDEALAAARSAAGGRYVNILGAATAHACLDAGALDEVLVFVAPVLLGDGVRLFAHPGGTRVPLTPLRTHRAGSMTALWFRVGE